MGVDSKWRELYSELRELSINFSLLMTIFCKSNNPAIGEEVAKSLSEIVEHLNRRNDQVMALESLSELEEGL